MLELKQIQLYYPDNLKPFKKNILREYIQYKILEIIYSSEYADKMFFMGGTALRIIYSNSRFSEDLDFDNKGLAEKDFESLLEIITKGFELEGYRLSFKNKYNKTFRSYIKIHDITYDFLLSPHKAENIDIRIDAEPQNFNYAPDKPFLNKFDIFTQIFVAPPDILLAQKIFALFNRQRIMGRDFFDIVYLLGKTSPNYDYLGNKLYINNGNGLRSRLLELCEKVDLEKLSGDVKPFLFRPSDSIKVSSFQKYIKNLEL